MEIEDPGARIERLYPSAIQGFGLCFSDFFRPPVKKKEKEDAEPTISFSLSATLSDEQIKLFERIHDLWASHASHAREVVFRNRANRTHWDPVQVRETIKDLYSGMVVFRNRTNRTHWDPVHVRETIKDLYSGMDYGYKYPLLAKQALPPMTCTTFGELLPVGVDRAFQYLNPHHSFKRRPLFDLGAGPGRLIMQLFLQGKSDDITGIEIVSERFEAGKAAFRKLCKSRARTYKIISESAMHICVGCRKKSWRHRTVMYRLGNLCSMTSEIKEAHAAPIIFLETVLYPSQALTDLFTAMRSGTRLMTYQVIESLLPSTIDFQELVAAPNIPTSWCDDYDSFKFYHKIS